MSRPFFSIVIPCYNPSKFLRRTLTSIVLQKLPKEEIEVVLSDDHSTEDYSDIVKEFEDKLLIKRTQTEYNCCPGNTREAGTKVATGEWLTFMDQDDEYYPEVFGQVKSALQRSGENMYMVTDFNEVAENGTIRNQFRGCLNWCHGKFYNKDNFWDKYNIHFKKDLKSHEDIYICSTVNCLLNLVGKNARYFKQVTYKWNANPESLSRSVYVKEYGGYYYLESHFADYIESTGYVYLEKYMDNENGIEKAYAFRAACEVTAFCYFYVMSFIFRKPKDYIKENIDAARSYIELVKSIFEATNNDIYVELAKDNAFLYDFVLKNSKVASGPFIPYLTIKQWLDTLAPDPEDVSEDVFTLNDRVKPTIDPKANMVTDEN